MVVTWELVFQLAFLIVITVLALSVGASAVVSSVHNERRIMLGLQEGASHRVLAALRDTEAVRREHDPS